MKKIFYLALIAMCFSCGETAPSLTEEAGITELKKVAEENFGADTEIYKLDFSATEHLENNLGSLTINYIKDGIDYSRNYNNYNGTFKLEDEKEASKAFQTEFFLKSKQGKIKIKDIDFNLILKKYNEALKLIPEEFEGFSLYTWKFEVNNKNEVTSSFSIEGTKKGESTHAEGRNIVTNYYEFEFKTNKDGTLETK